MKREFMGISDNRLAHMYGVAQRAAELARDVFEFSPEKQQEMFVLGFVHDIGYEWSVTQREHAHVGGQLLASMGLKSWRAIYDHGDPEIEHMGEELIILNLADMQVGSQGLRITVSERLSDIKERYGGDSAQYVEAVRLVDNLQKQLISRGKNLNILLT